MITGITINNVATYSTPATIDDLRKINFVFGANGTGKTTISRVIDQADGHTHCSLQWQGAGPLEVMVYNQDFVERNFNQENTVKGVFTLGDNQVEAERELSRLKPEIDQLTKALGSLNVQLKGEDGQSGKIKEFEDLEPDLRERCWRQKQRHDAYFQEAFFGVRNNAERFKEKVISEKVTNEADLLTLEQLKEKASTVFAKSLDRIAPLTTFDATCLTSVESNAILQKAIVGNKDVDIAKLIESLGSSDWVKQGMHYHAQDQTVCPFCQQPTDENLANSLTEFFSDTYEQEVQVATNLFHQYQADCARIMEVISNIEEANNPFLQKDLFESETQSFRDRIERNKGMLQGKISEPSRGVTLEPVQPIVTKIIDLITRTNQETEAHNQTVLNISSEKKTLTAQVWRFVLNELKEELSKYNQDKIRLNRTIQGMQNSFSDKQQQKIELLSQVEEIEKQSTSILPAKDDINRLLKTFGFDSFSIEVVDEHGHYQISRKNGEDASRSLSEGEKTFITFLYFYSLIKGAHSSSGTTANRVVVFDDPISSLDSDILYIVSSLIKGIFGEVRNSSGYIKQAFILTHNVYFHKEISFNKNRSQKSAMSDESFWMVKKLSQGSIVERCTENPIRSAYELLWEDVKNPNTSSLTIQNTLRRILENYFTMWGGKSKDEIVAFFEGRDKLICQSLFSWVNDGSHSIHDDLYINHGDRSNEAFLRVFQEVFERSEQVGHYNMMIGNLPNTNG